ncbi:DNA polymerase III subunit delta' [Oecophyllibacter saccharovorans]|uniref:DNA polymerase III subunit delta' n=1 Tax=Oecophyllibacter saccharovorans TaxID=2558360 RepID=UPI001144214C|nr:DNA polymerase III subunit delta' [Oecophyllibacter saccharovorans]QDH14587.1 DNA polymerase III subunit delta' [Oecophyllibacter saccharovorans]
MARKTDAPSPGEHPEPRQSRQVSGHDRALQIFREAIERDRLHHAWLICGPAGIGKASLAFRLARILLGAEDHATPAGRRISAGTHGDLLEISRKPDPRKGRLRSEITVADVQPLQKFLHHTATEGGWRVVIVDGVEFLNRFAANALLKVLEEPPPRAVLLLTTATPGALLPTIRSRCRILNLNRLSPELMEALLPDLPPDVLRRAHGSPGRALFLAQDRNGEIAALARQALQGQPLTVENWQKISQIARQTDGAELFCDYLSVHLAQQAKEEIRRGALARGARLAQKTAELEKLEQAALGASLDRAQMLREAYGLASD